MRAARSSSLSQHAVPPLYACYCLRSLSRPNQTYIGSTPDPTRRIRQHNGLTKQGAYKTRFARPWHMDMLVYGFPSRIAALQFEWSWQTPHYTRHLKQVLEGSSRERGEALYAPTRRRVMRGPQGRERMELSTVPEVRMRVMRALLASEPYCFWGLRVALYSEWAFGLWQYLESQWQERHRSPRWAKSRITSRALAPTAGEPLCDFRGVLGENTPLQRGGAPLEAFVDLPEALSASAQQKRMQGPRYKLGPEPSAWEEPTPRSRSGEDLGLTWQHVHTLAVKGDGVGAHADRAEEQGSRRRKKQASTLLAQDSGAREVEAALMRERVAPAMDADDLARPASVAQTFATQSAHCALCHEPVQLHDAHSYSLCPSAHAVRREGARACTDVFHLTCLARHFLATEKHSRRTFCLPVKGSCPSKTCAGHNAPVSWADVVRRVFRRAALISA